MAYPQEGFAILICIFWNTFNFLFILLCLGVVWELQQRRRYHRIWAEGPVEVFIPRLGRTLPGALQDVSLGGVSLQPRETVPLEDGEKVILRAAGSDGRSYSLPASVVRNSLRRGRREWGCEFSIPDLSVFAEIVSFVYGDSGRWAQFWEQGRARPVRISRGFYRLIKIGWKGALRNFKGVLFPHWTRWARTARELPGRIALSVSLRRKILKALLSGLPKSGTAAGR